MGLRSTLADISLLLRYGTRAPTDVDIPGGPVPLRINPNDRRARNLIARRAARGIVSTARQLWMDAIEHVRPDLALDVGANYGECLLGVQYPPGTSAIGIEANPSLLPFLHETLERHPDRQRIRIVHGLASDSDDTEGLLRFDPTFSGTASAVPAAAARLSGEVAVRSITIDSLISGSKGPGLPRSIVFKMDIEGFEGVAMRGFRGLSSIRDRLGILEFDLAYLSSAPVDGDCLLKALLDVGLVFDSAFGTRRLRRVESLKQLRRIHDTTGDALHTDLVVVSAEGLLPRSWRIR